MAREFKSAFTDEFDFTVELDESGQPYVERGTGGRVGWMVLGLFVVGIVGWYLVSYEGSEGWLLSVATPAAIGAITLVGVVAEPIFGSDRSAVVEDKHGRFYLEMMTCSRWYVTAAGVGVLATGASMFLSVRAPDLVSARPGRGSGLVSLAESVPLGEFVLLFVAVVVALYAFMKAYEGRMRIVEK